MALKSPETKSEAGEPVDDFKMSLFEHLAELRTRLSRVAITVLVLGTASLVFARYLYGFLMRPVLLALPPGASSLVYTSAIEEINVLMKIGMYTGLFLAAPVLLYQIWGFVAPGLYQKERKLAGPFVASGTLAFVAGAAFCYFLVLPQMFGFLLQKEGEVALVARLDTARLREDDALRYLRLGDVGSAGTLARLAMEELEAAGEGRPGETNDVGAVLSPNRSVDVKIRLEGLGRLVDAVNAGFGGAGRPVLLQVMQKRMEATTAFGKGDFDGAARLSDEAAALLSGVAPERAGAFGDLWNLETSQGKAQAQYESLHWTRPMLSMSEQLTLVLVLLLAFGVIFQLPLVMAVLGLAGLVTSTFLFKYQRHAFVVCLILAAVITPTGDVVNLALMGGPMLLCYELGVVLVWLLEKRRARDSSTEGQPA